MFLLYYQICLYCPYYGMHIHKKLLTTNRQKGTLGNKSNFKTAATSGYSYYMKALRVVQYINPPTNCLHCISQQQNQNCSGLGPTACSEVEGIKGHLSPFLSPQTHIFGRWEEAGGPGENPHRPRENMQTTKAPRAFHLGIYFLWGNRQQKGTAMPGLKEMAGWQQWLQIMSNSHVSTGKRWVCLQEVEWPKQQ